MSFRDLPVELYGVIMEYMEDPHILFQVTKELHGLQNHGYLRNKHVYYELHNAEKLRSHVSYVYKLDIFDHKAKDYHLKYFTNLRALCCPNCEHITDVGVLRFKKTLRILEIKGTNITDLCIAQLKLYVLDCRNTQYITDRGIAVLRKYLKVLICNGNRKITDDSVRLLRKLRVIHYDLVFKVSYWKFQGVWEEPSKITLETVKALPHIKHING